MLPGQQSDGSFRVEGSGLTAGGDANLAGTNVAGRDLTIHYAQPAAQAQLMLFQLPPDTADFTDREAELRSVREALEPKPAPTDTALKVMIICGKAGVGKTALAVKAAHQLRECYPAGQLYVNLRGGDLHPLDPSAVLAELLRALGVDSRAIPRTLDGRTWLYRSKLAGKRVLVLLDNAASEAQVRPLLPGSPTCAALITSRSPLPALEGARRLDLEVLSLDDAMLLLVTVAGRSPHADVEAARTVTRLCGRLPLAVRIAGAKLKARRHWDLVELARYLKGQQDDLLAALRVGDLEVRSSFGISYQSLPNEGRHAFRLLGLLQATTFPVWVAAALLGKGSLKAEELVEGLVDGQLIEVAGKDALGQARYTFHDLLRSYARERLREEEPPMEQQAALERLGDETLRRARHAAATLFAFEPQDIQLALPGAVPAAGSAEEAARQHQQSLQWFTVEREHLLALVRQLFEAGFWRLTWQLANALLPFLEFEAGWRDWSSTQELALTAARRAGDRRAEAHAMGNLGRAYFDLGRHDDAVRFLEASSRRYRELGDDHAAAIADVRLGRVYRELGRLDEARSRFEYAVETLRAKGDRRWEDQAIGDLGVLARRQRRWGEALAYLTQVLETRELLGDRHGVAVALEDLGQLHLDQGQLEDAEQRFQESLKRFSELGDTRYQAVVQCFLGSTYLRQGRLEEAEAYLRQALPYLKEANDRRWVAEVLVNLGEVAAARGDHDGARFTWQEALRILEELGSPKASLVRARIEGSQHAEER